MSVAFHVPELGEGVYEAELVEWKVAPGTVVRHGQTLAEVVTDKATMELPAPFSGKIDRLKIDPGAVFQVGDEILDYEPLDEARPGSAPPDRERLAVAAETTGGSGDAKPNASASVVGRPRLDVRAAPSVRRMARALGVDLTTVRGSGKGGRILVDDLAQAVREAGSAQRRAVPSGPPLELDLGTCGTTVPLVGLRRKVAEQMTKSAMSIPHYSYIDVCNVSRLVRLRDELVDPLAAEGIKLTYLAFWVQAAVRALKQVPIVNATFSEDDQTITLHDRYDIGIATATTKGLVVPVLRAADRLTLPETARAIEQLIRDVRELRAKPDQLRGSTFTITSIGNLGGLVSTPIINHPEVGIMGVGKIRRSPEYDDRGEIRPVDQVYLSFSFDHRIVDGAVAAVFGNAILDALTHPARLLL